LPPNDRGTRWPTSHFISAITGRPHSTHGAGSDAAIRARALAARESHFARLWCWLMVHCLTFCLGYVRPCPRFARFLIGAGRAILGAWLIAVGQGSAPPATFERDERGRRVIPVGGRHGSNSERAHGLGPSNGRCPAAVCWRSVGYPRPLSRTQFCSCHPLTASTGRIRPQGFYCLVLDTLAALTLGPRFHAVGWRCKL